MKQTYQQKQQVFMKSYTLDDLARMIDHTNLQDVYKRQTSYNIRDRKTRTKFYLYRRSKCKGNDEKQTFIQSSSTTGIL